MIIEVALVNKSTVVSDAEVASLSKALEIQANRDFAPLWYIPQVVVTHVGKGGAPPRGYWPIFIQDNATVEGALGYHDLTGVDLPVGYVFARTAIDAKMSWTATASHEFLEMLGDPKINRSANFPDPSDQSKTIVLAWESCDPVEDDSIGYHINGILVSDFVTLDWFDPAAPRGKPYDFLRHTNAPLQLLRGGYIGYLDASGSWTQKTADGLPHHSGSPQFVGNRWHRRVAKHQARKAALREMTRA